jgi:hypothetical protein
VVATTSDLGSTIERPYSDQYLLAYSSEHVLYELDMLFGLAQVFARPRDIHASSIEDAHRLKMALIESNVVHVRNVIEFLYPKNVRRTDVVAADFLMTGEWDRLRPPISDSLCTARDRANVEIAHLTSSRIAGASPKKAWNFQSLAQELHPLLKLWASNALGARLSPQVIEVFSR